MDNDQNQWQSVYELEDWPDCKCRTCEHANERQSRLPPLHPTVAEHARECGIDPAKIAPRLRTIYCGLEHQIVWWSPRSWDESSEPGIIETCTGYEPRQEQDDHTDVRTNPRVVFGRRR